MSVLDRIGYTRERAAARPPHHGATLRTSKRGSCCGSTPPAEVQKFFDDEAAKGALTATRKSAMAAVLVQALARKLSPAVATAIAAKHGLADVEIGDVKPKGGKAMKLGEYLASLTPKIVAPKINPTVVKPPCHSCKPSQLELCEGCLDLIQRMDSSLACAWIPYPRSPATLRKCPVGLWAR